MTDESLYNKSISSVQHGVLEAMKARSHIGCDVGTVSINGRSGFSCYPLLRSYEVQGNHRIGFNVFRYPMLYVNFLVFMYPTLYVGFIVIRYPTLSIGLNVFRVSIVVHIYTIQAALSF